MLIAILQNASAAIKQQVNLIHLVTFYVCFPRFLYDARNHYLGWTHSPDR